MRPASHSGVAFEERVTADLARDLRYEPAESEVTCPDSLPPLTLAQVVETLMRLGFDATFAVSGAWVILTRAERTLSLPLRDADTVLELGLLRELLSAADVGRRAFVEAVCDELPPSHARPRFRNRA